MPNPICPKHNFEMRLVPAGISKKTGRKYNAFFACQVEGCDYRPSLGTPTNLMAFERGLNEDIKGQRIERMYADKVERIEKYHGEKQDSIARSVSLNNAVALYAHRPEINLKHILELAEEFYKYLTKE